MEGMVPDSVRAFVNARTIRHPEWWHSNDAIWEAYLDFCREREYPVVGGGNALGRYLNELLDGIETSRRTIQGDVVRGTVGLVVEGVPGYHIPTGSIVQETHDGLPVNRVTAAEGYQFVVAQCVICGEEHRHGRSVPMLRGEYEYDHKVAHCPLTIPGGYYIRLASELLE